MIPGPDHVYACRGCGSLVRIASLVSGNTVGAVWWTDGKMSAPMLPEVPSFSRCGGCRRFFWVSGLKEVGKIQHMVGGSGARPEWLQAPRIRELEEDELLEAIDAGLFGDRNEELYLRVRAWWAANEPLRDLPPGEGTADGAGLSQRAQANLERLAGMFDSGQPDERLFLAEIERERGRFETALDLLRADFPAQFSAAADRIRELAQARDALVRRISPKG